MALIRVILYGWQYACYILALMYGWGMVSAVQIISHTSCIAASAPQTAFFMDCFIGFCLCIFIAIIFSRLD